MAHTGIFRPLARVGQRLYVRIWLAVVLAVAVLTLLLGWAWRMAAEPPLQEITRTKPRSGRFLITNDFISRILFYNYVKNKTKIAPTNFVFLHYAISTSIRIQTNG